MLKPIEKMGRLTAEETAERRIKICEFAKELAQNEGRAIDINIVNDVADHFEVHPGTVINALDHHGVPRERVQRGSSGATRRALIALTSYFQGKSLRECGEDAEGMSKQAVDKIVRWADSLGMIEAAKKFQGRK